MTERAVLILNTVDTLLYKFLWDERKEDEELPRGEIEEAIESGEISVALIMQRFTDGFENHMEQREDDAD